MKKIFLFLIFATAIASCHDGVIREKGQKTPFVVKSVERLDDNDVDDGNKMPTLYQYEISNGFDGWELRTDKIYAVNDTIEITKKTTPYGSN